MPTRSSAIINLADFETNGSPHAVEVVDGLAFVADGKAGLFIADVADPRNPIVLGSLDTPGDAIDLEVVGRLVYVADFQSLRIIDASDPRAPVELGSIDVPVRRVTVAGGRAYLVGYSGGLRIVDVADPAAPALLGTFESGVFRAVAVSGDVAFVDGNYGLRIIDVSDPAAPMELGHLETFGLIFDLGAAGDRVVLWGSDVVVVDVSDPTAPKELGRTDCGTATRIVVADGLAYGVDYAGLCIVDVTGPTAPELVGRIGARLYLSNTSVAVSDGVAFVSAVFSPGGSGRVQIADLGVLERPAQIGSAFASGAALGVGEGFAVVAEERLVVFDVSDPTLPVEVGRLEGHDRFEAQRLRVAGTTVYLVDWLFPIGLRQAALRVVDVSDPAAPRELARLSFSRAFDIALFGDVLYLATGDDLRIIDVANPADPREIGAIDVAAWRAEVGGSLLYVAGSDALWIFDLADPRAPVEIAALTLPGAVPRALAIGGGIAYIGGDFGFRIVDVADPAHPVDLGTTGGYERTFPFSLGLAEGRLFVSDGAVRVYDISDPLRPVPLGGLPPSFRMQLADGLVYSIDFQFLRILDFGPEYAGIVDAAIEISPGAGRGSVVLGRNRKISVALLGSADFDVERVDIASLRLGPGAAPPSSGAARLGAHRPRSRDVDGDGYPDLVVSFRTRATGLTRTDSEVCLTGEIDGVAFVGCSAIDVKRPPLERLRRWLGRSLHG